MKRVWGLLAVSFALIGGDGMASAAARFDRAVPGPEQVVTVSPARIDIYTVRATSPNPLGTQAMVVDRLSQRVDRGDTVVDRADHHHFSVGLQPNLLPGRYVVSFKTLGEADLDHDGGNYAFYVGRAPSTAELAADTRLSLTTLDDPASLSGYQRGAVEGGLTLVVGLPAIYYVRQRRKRKAATRVPGEEEIDALEQ